jgi:hypothetical protein
MNEDYLWDKSGEPDPDVERLENALGRLRYRRPAEPLPLPAVTTRRPFRLSLSRPALAIAATLLIFLLAGGLWLKLRRPDSTGEKALATGAAVGEKLPGQVVSGPHTPIVPENPGEPRLADAQNRTDAAAPTPVAPPGKPPRRLSPARVVTARSRQRQLSPDREQLAREGEMAKAQLIMALHIASDKLSAVQKKIQVNPGT